jgi:hypothetical protein
LTLIGHATETEFKCPLSQFVLADALGLTAIHINRTLAPSARAPIAHPPQRQ